MDYENIDVSDILAQQQGGAGDNNDEEKDGNDGGGAGRAGRKGHWGYGGDEEVNEADVFRVDDDDDDDEGDGEPVDPEHELPAFANAANRELNAAVIATEKRVHGVKAAAAESKERVTVMKEHLKNVIQEIGHTQKLLEAKTREVKSEEHLKSLAEREIGRLRQETRRLDGKADEIRDALNNVQNAIFKGSEQLEQFKVAMNFNQEELEQWALAAKQKEDDNQALEAYQRADEAKIKEMTLALEKLTLALTERKRDLERETTETQAKQIELDKTAEEFRQLHRERQDLVRQWKDALDTVSNRDSEIAEAGNRYATAQERFRAKKEALAEQAKMLAQMQAENVEVEGKIAGKARAIARLREDFMTAQAKLAEFQDEVEVMKNTLQKAASDVAVLRTASGGLTAAVDEKTLALEAARAKYRAAEKKLQLSSAAADKVEAAAVRREEELKEEESRHEESSKEVIALKEALFKQNTELFNLRKRETTLISEIAGSQAAAKNLSAKIHKLDSESVRQQELIYTAEFQIQQLERKVARASGERSDEEKQQLQARIAELNTELDAALAQEKLLTNQAKVLREDLRRTQRQQSDMEEQLTLLKAKATEQALQSKATEESLKATTREKEEVMVSHDLLKLEVRKLRSVLSGRANELFGLENHKAQLEMSILERRKEISVHLELQRATTKMVEEERHKLAMDLKDRLAKIGVLRAKYDTLCARMKADDEDGGGERSQAYFVIKAAQKREELQREGDELDAEIRKLEREVKALTATLASLTDMNSSYRLSQTKADLSGSDGEKLRKLQAQSKAAADVLFRKKRDLQHAATDVDEETRRLNSLTQQVAQTRDHIEHLKQSKARAEDEVAKVLSDVRRATESLSAASTSHRRTYGGWSPDEETPEEVSFRAQAVADTNSNVLFTLAQLAKEFPEMQPTLLSGIQQNGLKLPQRPPSRHVA